MNERTTSIREAAGGSAAGRFTAKAGRLATLAVAVYLLVAVTYSALGSPGAALAVPDPITGIEYGEGLYAGPPSVDITSGDSIAEFLLQPFVAGANLFTGASIALVKGTASTSILTAQFDEIAPGVLGVMRDAHRVAVVPLANVIAAVVFTVGLVKLLANSSSAESGVDAWKLMLIFICYGAALVVINASWEIMEALYAVALRVVGSIAGLMPSVPDHNTVVEGAPNSGIVIGVLVMSFFMLVVTAVCCLLINAMILVRGLEIYLYTCYSPVAFAFMVTEGGRQQTEAFLKRYTALLLAGGIQMLLMIAFAISSTVVGSAGEFTESTDAVAWVCRYVASFVWVVVIAFMMTKSSSLARDLIGV